MIITRMLGGLGNQFFQYAVARRLAHHLNTEFKIDKSPFDSYELRNYQLDDFNVKNNFATAEDLKKMKYKVIERNISTEGFMSEVLNCPDDTYLAGDWQCEKYFSDIENIIREEFTLKQNLIEQVKFWSEKINSSDCAVSVHIRHGDYAILPRIRYLFGILPLNYYVDCINELQKYFDNITAFIFSDDLQWVKENLKLNVPMEFVDNVPRDTQEIFLMSQCDHNIIANSTFSWWGAWLNKNPNKKIFAPDPWFRFPVGHKDIVPNHYIKMPVDFKFEPEVKLPPIFSIVIYIQNNRSTLNLCLGSIVSQGFKFFEIIIIDDKKIISDEDELHRIFFEDKFNIHYKRLNEQINKFSAWNIGINISSGDYILFFTDEDCLVNDALHNIYFDNEKLNADVIHSTRFFQEDEPNNFNGYFDEAFKEIQKTNFIQIKNNREFKFFIEHDDINKFLSTKVFKRKFLLDNEIKFKEKIIKNIELFFLTECICCTSKYSIMPLAFNVKRRIINED